MNQLVLPIQASQWPAGACPANYQDLLSQLVALMSVVFPNTFKGVTASTTPPTDTSQVWQKVDTLGRPTQIYVYAQGQWLSLHPELPGSIKMICSAAPDFTSYDGGDSNALGVASGPMWQLPVDANGNPVLRAQFPLGLGTLPSGTIVSAGQTGGEETHRILANEMFPHTHTFTLQTGGTAPSNYQCLVPPVGSAPNGTSLYTTSSFGGDSVVIPPTQAAAHNNMPPFCGVTFIQRTSRLYYAST